MTKIVITGGPCSGKSTLVGELAGRGHAVVYEVAAEVFRGRRVKDHTQLSADEMLSVQREIAEMQMQREASIRRDEEFFLDRSMIDNLAYHKIRGLPIDPRYKAFVLANKYDAVFFLQMIQPYEKDGVRVEDEQTAMRLGEAVYRMYIDFDYEPIRLSSDDGVKRRVSIIEDYLKQHTDESGRLRREKRSRLVL